jgi:dienelactone hydrolase
MAARIEGLLLRPPGEGPFPALVLLHGCGGLRTRNGAVQAKPRFWAEHLRDRGYVTLLVDSFSPRGIDEVCTGRHILSPVRDRADDARGALRFLQGRTDVRADRIGLLGWSNGAAAALSVLFDDGVRDRDFRAAVAFYPNCTRQYPGGPDFRPYAPLFILVGALDDWTPAAPCVALAERGRAAGAPIAIKVYPGAHHSFDAPATPVRYRPEVRNHNKPQGCCGATVGTDPAARADAIVEVTRFFAAELGGPSP